jgi:hypothetical protein
VKQHRKYNCQEIYTPEIYHHFIHTAILPSVAIHNKHISQTSNAIYNTKTTRLLGNSKHYDPTTTPASPNETLYYCRRS